MLKFLKKNGYYVMLAVCLICIGTMIAVAISANNNNTDYVKPSATPSVTASAKPTVTPAPTVSPTTTPTVTVPQNFIVPVENAEVGLEFTVDSFVFSETLGQWQTHNGLDFLTAEPLDVKCIADGVIESVITDDILNGNTVVVSHSGGLKSYYMSLSSEIPVKAGDKVDTSTVLGKTSMSAYNEFKEGNHLHLEMTLNDELVDPSDYVMGNK